MKKIVIIGVLVSLIGIVGAIAALPPRYQNIKDLDVMVAYIKQHPDIASTLKSINLSEHTIYFGENCKAIFERKAIVKPAGWVGPAAPLEFKKLDCNATK